MDRLLTLRSIHNFYFLQFFSKKSMDDYRYKSNGREHDETAEQSHKPEH